MPARRCLPPVAPVGTCWHLLPVSPRLSLLPPPAHHFTTATLPSPPTVTQSPLPSALCSVPVPVPVASLSLFSSVGRLLSINLNPSFFQTSLSLPFDSPPNHLQPLIDSATDLRSVSTTSPLTPQPRVLAPVPPPTILPTAPAPAPVQVRTCAATAVRQPLDIAAAFDTTTASLHRRQLLKPLSRACRPSPAIYRRSHFVLRRLNPARFASSTPLTYPNFPGYSLVTTPNSHHCHHGRLPQQDQERKHGTPSSLSPPTPCPCLCTCASGQPSMPVLACAKRHQPLLTKCLLQPSTSPSAKDAAAKRGPAEPVPETTPLEKMLQNAGPMREDGSDRFYGFENVRHPQPQPSLLFNMLT